MALRESLGQVEFCYCCVFLVFCFMHSLKKKRHWPASPLNSVCGCCPPFVFFFPFSCCCPPAVLWASGAALASPAMATPSVSFFTALSGPCAGLFVLLGRAVALFRPVPAWPCFCPVLYRLVRVDFLVDTNATVMERFKFDIILGFVQH